VTDGLEWVKQTCSAAAVQAFPGRELAIEDGVLGSGCASSGTQLPPDRRLRHIRQLPTFAIVLVARAAAILLCFWSETAGDGKGALHKSFARFVKGGGDVGSAALHGGWMHFWGLGVLPPTN
jgi:hypothetical protein